MKRSARRLVGLGSTSLSAIALTILVGAAPAAAECDVGICQGNPCTITGTHQMDEECTLAFGATTDVTLAPRAALIFPVGGGGRVTAHDFTVQGTIRGKALSFQADITGDFRTEGRGRISITRLRNIGGDVSILADGDVTLAGSSIKVRGDWGYVFVDAGGNVQVDAPIKARGCQDDFASIELHANGSITTTVPLSSRSCGTTAGGSMSLEALGDITVGGTLVLSGGSASDFPVDVYVQSGGSVTLGKVQLLGLRADHSLEVHAGADITLAGNVLAKAFKPADGNGVLLDPGPTGIVRIAKSVNVSCGPACDVDKSITVSPGCYTDVTGADLAARPDGTISLGCTCIHPTGSNVCDGGCVGLDSATFDPPITTSLPPCS